jgi:hypothetical protein
MPTGGNGEAHWAVCDDEATAWRKCTADNYRDASLDLSAACAAPIAAFDRCAAGWRAAAGPSVQVKGAGPGDPPPQCALMSCVYGRCVEDTKYDFDKCKQPMQMFKRCVKTFYLSEYVV